MQNYYICKLEGNLGIQDNIIIYRRLGIPHTYPHVLATFAESETCYGQILWRSDYILYNGVRFRYLFPRVVWDTNSLLREYAWNSNDWRQRRIDLNVPWASSNIHVIIFFTSPFVGYSLPNVFVRQCACCCFETIPQLIIQTHINTQCWWQSHTHQSN